MTNHQAEVVYIEREMGFTEDGASAPAPPPWRRYPAHLQRSDGGAPICGGMSKERSKILIELHFLE